MPRLAIKWKRWLSAGERGFGSLDIELDLSANLFDAGKALLGANKGHELDAQGLVIQSRGRNRRCGSRRWSYDR